MHINSITEFFVIDIYRNIKNRDYFDFCDLAEVVRIR
jgi:hypothetical protein